MQKHVSKRQSKINEKKMEKAYEFTYHQYLEHLKTECPSIQTHKCKFGCSPNKKMSLQKLKVHYETECEFIEVECLHCR